MQNVNFLWQFILETGVLQTKCCKILSRTTPPEAESILPRNLLQNLGSRFVQRSLHVIVIFILFVGNNLNIIAKDAIDITDFKDSSGKYDNAVYDQRFRSIELYNSGAQLSNAIITLNTSESLTCCFDEINPLNETYYYTAIHCNADWSASELLVSEYLTGMTEGIIDSYAPSLSTFIPYHHYEFTFPNDNFSLQLSGNYILIVFSPNGSGGMQIKFMHRFMVAEQNVSISGKVIRAQDVDAIDIKQDVQVSVNTNGYRIHSPFRDLHLAILQNGRWDNALTQLKPFMVSGTTIDYTHLDGSNYFDGSNEFRYVNLTSLRGVTDVIRNIEQTDTGYYVTLWEREKRTFKVYTNTGDADGHFLIKNVDFPDGATSGEYVWVRFFLPYDFPVTHGDVYVAGSFNGWNFNEENRMRYNYVRKGYMKDMLMKQGYFDYMFALLPHGSTIADLTFFEGNHSETENQYLILLYQRKPGEMYDRLIGLTNLSYPEK